MEEGSTSSDGFSWLMARSSGSLSDCVVPGGYGADHGSDNNSMSQHGLRSLPVLRDEVQFEREAQLRHFDGLDSEAGIILGFAGALAALAPRTLNIVVDLGRLAAVVGALTALWAFWPRTFPVTELRPLRDLYLGADPRFTELRLLDTHIEIAGLAHTRLLKKASRLKLAMMTLAVAALLVGTGTLVG